jgi:hypothetical protein
MLRKLSEAVLSIIFFIAGKWFVGEDLKPELYGMSIGLACAFIIELIDLVIKEWSFIRLYFDCYKPFTRKEIRLSISYLYRIEINGKYLLIKSGRLDEAFQPVGGVYKYFDPEAKRYLDSIGAITDNHLPNDNINEYDLRLKLLNRRKIRKFLNWFFSGQDREWDPWREFYEELVITNILPPNEFGYIHYELIGQHFEPIHFDQHFNIDTFKYADIYKPKYVNNRQCEEMKKLISVESPQYIWVSEDEIRRGRSLYGKRIADHTYKIFHTNKFE